MHPRLALVAIDPTFFRNRVVLELLQFLLSNLTPVVKYDGLFFVEDFVTVVAPVVLLRTIREVVRMTLDPLHTTLSLTVEHRRLETTLLSTTKRACFSLAL